MMTAKRRIRTALAAAAAASVVIGGTIFVPQFALASNNTLIATSALNVRAEPTTGSAVLGVLSAGEQVERRGDPQGEWTPVSYAGQDAWVFSQYSTLDSIDAAPGGTATAIEPLNVRAAASTLTTIYGVLTVGESVAVTGEQVGGWVPVQYKGRDAFCYAPYLKSDATTDAPATNPYPVTPEAPQAPEVVNEGGTADNSGTGGDGFPDNDNDLGNVVTIPEHDADTGSGDASSADVTAPDEPAVPADDGVAGEAEPSEPTTSGEDQPSEPVTSDETEVPDTDTSAPEPSTDPAPDEGSVATGSANARTALNVRSGPGTSYPVLGTLSTGEQISTRGDDQSGWTPVIYNGQDGWVSSEFLSYTGEVDEEEPAAGQTTTGYTTTDVNLRTGPSLDYRVARVLDPGTEIQLTGVTQNGYSQVDDGGTLLWISTTYVSDTPVTTGGGSGPSQGPSVPPGSDTGTSLNTGGSSGLDGLTDSGKGIVYAVRANFPQIGTMYGVRPDSIPDHPSGRAVDIMLPGGVSDVDLGNQIAAYMQANADSLNIEYIIYRQQIWINGQSGWTAMADRGSATANHMDHVHVSVNY
ncbi:SH3 domain-containing protein [Propionimicrobium sp. PCR01-08-3]|uniref:SH3 domain-containing protein n=1 Tax=Propionimicrobium sp. PCR01-08-3 TaxID=3052086 RepID=UPI00255C7D7C|nr:SH3 domain-containing protein [Propionimicrobium sp. PCR01-08-3]WIY81876.1 SH3 domain-containing protein [Propionimicrobium sp. PCR01-08-3]